MGGLSTQCGGVGRPRGRLLPGGGFGHLIGQTGAAGAGHGRRATAGTVKITQGQKTSLAFFSPISLLSTEAGKKDLTENPYVNC